MGWMAHSVLLGPVGNWNLGAVYSTNFSGFLKLSGLCVRLSEMHYRCAAHICQPQTLLSQQKGSSASPSAVEQAYGVFQGISKDAVALSMKKNAMN